MYHFLLGLSPVLARATNSFGRGVEKAGGKRGIGRVRDGAVIGGAERLGATIG